MFQEGKCWYVYILASKKNGTLYIGFTNSLLNRIHQYKTDYFQSFTSKYKVHFLVYFEIFSDPRVAINQETQLKRWKRVWKISLIEEKNPYWRDLYPDIINAYR